MKLKFNRLTEGYIWDNNYVLPGSGKENGLNVTYKEGQVLSPDHISVRISNDQQYIAVWDMGGYEVFLYIPIDSVTVC